MMTRSRLPAVLDTAFPWDHWELIADMFFRLPFAEVLWDTHSYRNKIVPLPAGMPVNPVFFFRHAFFSELLNRRQAQRLAKCR